jgi:beta-glucosidase
MTLAKRYVDHPSAPYYNLNQDQKTPYTEGIFVGYRGFDAKKIEPAFPFGFGLSFTTFAYSDLTTNANPDGSASVRVKVSNTGKRAGDEVVEVYVAPPKESVPRPPKELKGFARVSLGPGESKEVSVSLEPRSFAFWDDRAKDWAVEAGPYEVLVGASSRDIRLKQTLNVGARVFRP